MQIYLDTAKTRSHPGGPRGPGAIAAPASLEPKWLRHLKRAVEFAWHSRWWSLLSVAAQRAFALSLIEVDSDAIKPLADFEPRVGDILADVRYELGPVFSRLPLRG